MFVSPYCFLPGKGVFLLGVEGRTPEQNRCVLGLWVFLTRNTLWGRNGGGRVWPKLAFPSMGAWKKQWLWNLQILGLEVSKARSKACRTPCLHLSPKD